MVFTNQGFTLLEAYDEELGADEEPMRIMQFSNPQNVLIDGAMD